MTFTSVVQNGWTEDVGTWLLGLACGVGWAHRKIVRPARERHAELVARHDEHDERLKRLEDR